MRTICLVMIVRNEAAVIRRCLESAIGLIDHWVICDTGSTDGTQRVIGEVLRGIPGALHQVPWVSFGHNRTLALELARGKADYHLLIDADMTVNVRGEFRPKLSADCYLIRHEGDVDYWVERLVSDRHQWRYVGATHEFIQSDTAKGREKLAELSVTHHEDGGARGDKYQRDIRLLQGELAKDAGNARAVFYLAQSYRDTGNLPQAMEWYEKRALMAGWDEETWYALYQVARAPHRLGMAWAIVLNSYLTAYQFRPTRSEPLYYVARFYRENQEYDLGYLFSRTAIERPYPDDVLFIEKNIYRWELPLEYAACCEGLGKNEEANRIYDALLAEADVPESSKAVARQNRERGRSGCR